MRNTFNRLLFQATFLVLSLAALAACEPMVRPIATEPDVVSERIAAAAEKAAKSLNDMSSIDQVRTPVPTGPAFPNAPSSMTQLISVKWSGPIEQIVKTLASRAGMGFRMKGFKPAVPLTIDIDVYQKPLVEVLRDIGLQAGHRADLSVDARSGVVEIRYVPSDR